MVDPLKLSAYRSQLQWLDNCHISEDRSTTRFHLEQQGWIRGVGSCTPYNHFHTRAGFSREQVDQAVANLEIYELPAARGCTYIVPKQHFAIALALAQFPGDEPKMDTGERKLGFTWEQIDNLKSAVLSALKAGPADPRQLKAELGDKVKSFGADGKKYGITTDLPGVLQRLQKEGQIRRIPLDGRLDNERYAYTLWEENHLADFNLAKPELQAKLAQLYFNWIGPASLEEFVWFSGFSKRDARAAMEANQLLEWQPSYFGFQTHTDSIESWQDSLTSDTRKPPESNPQFLTCLDNLIMLTRNLALHIDETDQPFVAKIEGNEIPKGSLFDLDNHPIFDRGRLVGLWVYDEPNQELIYSAWAGDKDLIAQRAIETETYIKEQLGDARSFSMDSTKSRQPRINLLRAQPNYHG